MAVIACFDVETDAAQPYIYNVAAVDEADYEWLRDIWPAFNPTRYLIKPELLNKNPDYPPPIWMGWQEDENGLWWNPSYVPPETEE